ncbi:hypothetical protein EBR21_17950 [bacterium]|nr:hypothetical protein [bacterium]
MKTNKIFGFTLALMVSTQAMASQQDDSPPFDTFVCSAGNVSVQVKVQHYRQNSGSGPASISSNGVSWAGAWKWRAEREGTRLTGYHYLDVTANGQNSLGSFSLQALYTHFGQFSDSWVEMPGFSGDMNCQIASKSDSAN